MTLMNFSGKPHNLCCELIRHHTRIISNYGCLHPSITEGYQKGFDLETQNAVSLAIKR